MTSFNSFAKFRYFKWSIFYSEWQNFVLGVSDFTSMEGVKKRSESDKLRDKIKTLWTSFNENRNNLSKKYSADSKFITAYLSSFYLPNIQRTFSILTSEQNINEIKCIFSSAENELNILDFGSGPLSATLGLLLALDYAGMELSSKKINIMTIERSEQMINAGLGLLKSSFEDRITIEHQNFSSAFKVRKKADFILCANVFNELPIKHRNTTLESLLNILNGNLLIIEPGQDVHSKDLNSMRNDLIESKIFPINIISPCLHSLNCPLPSETERPDWCWFKIVWSVPDAVSLIDKITGLDHRQLNYSYLFLKISPPAIRLKSWKVISDTILPIGQNNRNRFENWMRNNIIEGNSRSLIRVPNDKVAKILLCSSEGKLSSLIGNKEILSSIKRGEILTSIPDGACLCKER